MALTRARVLWISIGCLLLSSPLLYGVGRNEIVSSNALDELAEPMLPGVSGLRAKVGVQKLDGACVALVARTLAAEGPPSVVASKLRRSQPGLKAVWWRKKKMWGVQSAEADDAAVIPEQLPPTVHRLMVEHAFLSGVKRVVVWRTVSVPSKLDPRCW